MTKLTIYYVDFEKTNRDDRWDASMGKFIGVDKITKIGTYEAKNDENPLYEAFEEFNIGNRGGYRVRSMSVGDVVVWNGTAYICAGAGWDKLELDVEKDLGE